jgi:hypothetical protein
MTYKALLISSLRLTATAPYWLHFITEYQQLSHTKLPEGFYQCKIPSNTYIRHFSISSNRLTEICSSQKDSVLPYLFEASYREAEPPSNLENIDFQCNCNENKIERKRVDELPKLPS